MDNIMRFLTPKSKTAYIDDKSSVRQALEKMRHHGYNALPVIDEAGMYVGTLTEGDFLWHLVRSGKPDLRDQEETPCRLESARPCQRDHDRSAGQGRGEEFCPGSG